MKLLINTSNLSVGGGMQVALSFINELNNFKNVNDYHIFLSSAIEKQIDQMQFTSNFHFYIIEKSPSFFRDRKLIVSKLNELENSIKPDIVFSVFGPSYWKPNSLHLMGVADGWIYNPKSIAYKQLSVKKFIKTKLLTRYKEFFIKKDAQYFVVETNDAKKKIIQNMNINEKNIFIVGNTYSDVFNNLKRQNKEKNSFSSVMEKNKNKFRLMLISHNYKHKNLKIIREVLPHLSQYQVEFILTIDDESYNNLFYDMKDVVKNLGTVQQNDCPNIYKQSDALFFPTLLETFSASYPEAMKMEIPILTSNYSFATDTCGDAALYFDPLNPLDIANKIKMLIDDEVLQKCDIYIAGDGPDKEVYKSYFNGHNLNNIKLLGNIDRQELLMYYVACDIFILPSFSDPNPLSVVEALFASKPILISNQCGNNIEAVSENKNGYVFNPYDKNDIRLKFNLIINDFNEYDNMGAVSLEIANLNFHPTKIVKRFLLEL